MSPPPVKRLRRIFPQILVPILLLLIASNLLILATTYIALDQELHSKDDRLLLTEAEKLSQQFQNVIQKLPIDARQASGFPALKGVIRAETEAQYAHELEDWEARLAQLFTGMLRANPALSQVRLIHNTGQERVRVDRYNEGGRIQRVPNSKLQNKGDRQYFTDTISLAADEHYLSKIELNRENGKITEPRELVIRVATPVFQPQDTSQAYGVLVINLGLAQALEEMASLAGNRSVMLIDSNGRYLFHSNQAIAITHATAPKRSFFDDFALTEQNLSANRVHVFDQQRLTVLPLSYGQKPLNQTQLYLAIASHNDDAVSVRDSVIRQTLFILAAVILFTVLLCIYITRRITTPIRRMSDKLAKDQRQNLMGAIPGKAPLEVQQLAQEFDRVYSNLTEQQHQLEVEISAKIQAQKSLEDKIDLLNKANQELQQFTYIASHDLQEPLRTIRSFITVLSQQYDQLYDDQGRTMLKFVDDAGSRMETLVKDLLDYGRIGVKSAPQVVNLSELIHSVQQDLAKAIEHSGAILQIDELPVLTGYETELRLLFQNLLANALKFSRPGITPKITISSQAVVDGWQFAISDNGIGIAEEYRDKIFGVFKRLHTKQEYAGTGIGLAHCKKVVELHGGKIWVEASHTDGSGSCFLFILKEPKSEKVEINPAG